MIRGLTMVALVLVTGTTVHAQTYSHGPGHVRPDSGKHHPHGPGHVRPDSAMHARLHGSWAGVLRAHAGSESRLAMAVTRDTARQVAVTFTADQSMRLGVSKDFVLTGDKLTWTQDLGGKPCKATAVVTPAKANAPDELNGTMTCARDAMTFSLRKNAD